MNKAETDALNKLYRDTSESGIVAGVDESIAHIVVVDNENIYDLMSEDEANEFMAIAKINDEENK